MKFEWDVFKNQQNIRKHGLDFYDAWEIFEGPVLPVLENRQDYGEDRWSLIGLMGNRIVVITFTQPALEIIRVISLRKALKHERKKFEKEVSDRLEPYRSYDG